MYGMHLACSFWSHHGTQCSVAPIVADVHRPLTRRSPLNLGMTNKFCNMLADMLSSPRWSHSKLVFCTLPSSDSVTNAVYLLGAFLLVHLSATVEEANEPFACVRKHALIPYRDATWVPSTHDLDVVDCWRAIRRAMKLGFYNVESFNEHECEGRQSNLKGFIFHHFPCDLFRACPPVKLCLGASHHSFADIFVTDFYYDKPIFGDMHEVMMK